MSQTKPGSGRVAGPGVGYTEDMKLIRTAALAGIAKKLYDESRKPHNQKKIQDALAQVKARRGRGTTGGTTGGTTNIPGPR